LLLSLYSFFQKIVLADLRPCPLRPDNLCAKAQLPKLTT